MKLIRCTFVFATVGVILCLCTAALYYLGNDCYGALGAISTIVSIVLGVVSIVYTYISGQETSELYSKISKQIERIEVQNQAFVDKIKAELSNENYNSENINRMREGLHSEKNSVKADT